MRWLLDAYAEPRSYRAIVYLLLGLPLGILGFVVVVVGLSVGLGLSVILVGIPVLAATMVSVRALADLEGKLASVLLGAEMQARSPLGGEAEGVGWRWLRTLLSDRHTWMSVTFLLLRLPLGILDFTVAVSVLGLALGGLAHPIMVAAGLDTQIGSWTIDTFAESLVYLPFSLVILLAAPRILLGWSAVPRRVVVSLLGYVDTHDLKRAAAEVIVHAPETDSFQILNALRLRFGRTPWLTITKTEATLLALEATGHIVSIRSGPRTVYAPAY